MTRSRMIALIAAVVLIGYLPVLPPLWVLLCLFTLSLLFALRRRTGFLAVFFCAGLLWAGCYGHHLMSRLLPSHWEGIDLQASGVVVGLPEQGLSHGAPVQRFHFRLQGPLCDSDDRCLPASGLLKLSWYSAQTLKPGDTGVLLVRLKRPHGMMNPGGFDYHSWLISQGFIGTGYVRDEGENRLVGSRVALLDQWRSQAVDRLLPTLNRLTHGGLIRALLLGDRRGIGPERWQQLVTTGTIHLIVISGLHVGLIAAVGYGMGIVCLLLTGRRAVLHLIPPCTAIIFAAAYSLAAGLSLPTVRALIMVVAVMLTVFLRRPGDVIDRLVLALLVCLLIDPLAVAGLSLWLSFSAVAVLVYASAGYRVFVHRMWPRWWRSFLAPHGWLLVGLLPVLASLTGQLAILSPLANCIAVPLFSFLVVPMVFLSGALQLAGCGIDWLWRGVDVLLGVFIGWLNVIESGFGAMQWYAPLPTPLTLFLAMIGVLWFLAPKGLPSRWLGLLCVLPIILYRPPIASGGVKVTVLDVGQGLAVVMQTHGHTVVYDVGPASDEFDTVTAVVLPFLHRQGVRTIDALIISHNDNDHAGRWPLLAEKMQIKKLYFGEPPEHGAPIVAGLASTRCQHQRWHWDGVDFAILNLHTPTQARGNNSSCVLHIQAGKQSVLLPGDIERSVELNLVTALGKQLKSTVLLAPHHGSRTSSSWPWVKTVAPEHVIISNGYRNRFNHPVAEIVGRYETLGAEIYRSDRDGAVQFFLGGNGPLHIRRQRLMKRRYWL